MGLQKLEAIVAGWYSKTPKMSEGSRKGLAGALWWLALIFGILQLWAAWSLWRLSEYIEPLNRAADYLNQYYGRAVTDNSFNFFFYLALVVVLIDAVILLMAVPGLKTFKKIGWNLLFISLLLNIVYGLVRMFSDVGGGFWSLLWSIIVSAAVGYFLFQVRDNFKGTGGVRMDDMSADASHKK
ncbi:MAG: hypothetical protein ACREGD_00360 [Candidatus Saccharimonadales bacterium]